MSTKPPAAAIAKLNTADPGEVGAMLVQLASISGRLTACADAVLALTGSSDTARLIADTLREASDDVDTIATGIQIAALVKARPPAPPNTPSAKGDPA